MNNNQINEVTAQKSASTPITEAHTELLSVAALNKGETTHSELMSNAGSSTSGSSCHVSNL